MENIIITKEILKALIAKCKGDGYKVIGLNKENRFDLIEDDDEFIIGESLPPSKISMKEHFFPKTEPLFYYKQNHSEVEIIDPEPVGEKMLVFGAKPCDTAALPILSKVFNWDYKDEFFNLRVENAVIIGNECSYKDEYCFCESVGLDQKNTRGSDLFLTPSGDGTYKLEVVTEKGKKFFDEISSFLRNANEGKNDVSGRGEIILTSLVKQEYLSKGQSPGISSGTSVSNSEPSGFNYSEVKSWLDNNFEHPYWDGAGEMCLGCAQCAFACPTCHCFDIVDEQNGSCAGRRAKNWDACQFSIFTKHASGHNPRDNQEKRYRQRINHKFKYYQDKFDEVLCTGCGRCSRGCPVSTDILQILQDINSLQNNITN